MDRKRTPFARHSALATKYRDLLLKEREREREKSTDNYRDSSAVPSCPGEPELLVRQNQDLRRRLDEEISNYRRRIDSYKQAQTHQAALVSRLQSKVIQYKQRCNDLEGQLMHHDQGGTSAGGGRDIDSPIHLGGSSSIVALPPPGDCGDRGLDVDQALRLLDDERRKSDQLNKTNQKLKEQLDEAQATNEAITGDLQKVTNEWENLREEMMLKEDEWKEEEHAFNEYYTTEHNRLLNLWRDVVSMKRMFNEVQATTDRDVVKIKEDIKITSKDMTKACNSLSTFMMLSNQNHLKEVEQKDHQNHELRNEIENIRLQHEATLAECRHKDDRIQQLLKDIQNLEERCGDAEHSAQQVSRMQDEVDLLQNALRDIAHAVIQDAETRDTETQAAQPHVHLTPSASIPPRSPKRGAPRTPTSPAFAESTISAVQASLHKYQLQIHELQVKLQTNKDLYLTAKKQVENGEEQQRNLTIRMTELTAQLDSVRAQATQLSQEKDMLMKSIDSMRTDKNSLEKGRLDMNQAIENLNMDYQKLQKQNQKLQKLVDSLEDEKMFLQGEVERMMRELEMREASLRAEEERNSRMREELLTVREDYNKTALQREMLESQKIEADSVIQQMEKGKGDVDLELEKLMLEKQDIQEALAKAENICCNLEHDKKRLHDEVKRLEGERACLQNQNADQHNDLISLRKELLQAEQIRLDLESEKVSLCEKIKFLEIEKEKVEAELAQVTRERNELSNQVSTLSRKREALNEENLRIRQRLEQASETNSRINRNLEELVKDNEEKQIILEANEKDLLRLGEQLASIRSEKESLEGVLFDTQSNLESCDIKRFQVEKENQDLLIRQEALKGQIARLQRDLETSERRANECKVALIQQMTAQEAEYHQIINNLKKCNEDNVKKLTEEREQVRASLEKKLQASVQQLGGEKDNEIQQLQDRIEALQQHIENLCQQHEEVLMRAENDKQQALLLAHHDQQALTEKLEACQRELDEEKINLDRVKRETSAQKEQDRATINQLRDELSRIKTRMEELRIKAEEEKHQLETRIAEIRGEREAAQQECEEVKVQLHLAEDRNDALQNQLQETVRRLKDSENAGENLRKELTDIRRQLTDSNLEKEKYAATNKELREHVKRTEAEKRETGRTLEEAFQKIQSLEDARSSLEAERARLQNAVREQEKHNLQNAQQLANLAEDLSRAQNASSSLQNDDKERQARLSSEIEERERAQQELHQLKKQIVELDGSLEIARQEMLRLRTRSDEEESRFRHREQELIVRLEDTRARERKLEDQKHNLEVCLADATQQIQELKARLGGTEGRVKALEQQLQQLEISKKEVEQKLSSVGTTLRRIAGIQLDGSVSIPFKLSSPSRRWSPARSHDHHGHHRHDHGHCHDGRGDTIMDVDPETIRKGVRNLMQQVAHIERERDDLRTHLNTMKKQLAEASDLQNKSDTKLSQALQGLRNLQEEKGSLEAKLGQKQAALQAQTEALQQKTHEIQIMREKLTAAELQVHSGGEEKSQYEDKLEKMRASISRLEGEKRSLQEELSRAESRSTKLELHRMSLEGDLQRVQMILQDKDGQNQKLIEKCEQHSRNVTSLEERCASLKTTIEQLNLTLERNSGTEAELRAEIATLQRTLAEATSNVSSSNERLKQLQKSLANSENERRVVAERLEAMQQNLTELRRSNQQLQDQNQRLQNELANNEVQRSGLESQLRLAATSAGGNNWDNGGGGGSGPEDELMRQLQSERREKTDLRMKIDSMNDKIRQLESEKRSLERAVTKAQMSRSKSFDRERPEKGVDNGSTNQQIQQLEQENRELRLKIRRLESQLADKESELTRLRNHKCPDTSTDRTGEFERVRAAQLQAERLLEAREQSHRQQVLRLENQIQLLREQLSQEIKRRQLYVLRSSRSGREVQHLHQTLNDSLRTVSQDPQLDSLLLEHEARKLDTAMSAGVTSAPLALPPPLYSSTQHK